MNSPTIWPVMTSTVKGYLAKVARLTAAREHAQERVLGEYLLVPPAPDSGSSQRARNADGDEPAADGDRPVVVARAHPAWAKVDAEQRERLGDPLSEEGRS